MQIRPTLSAGSNGVHRQNLPHPKPLPALTFGNAPKSQASKIQPKMWAAIAAIALPLMGGVAYLGVQQEHHIQQQVQKALDGASDAWNTSLTVETKMQLIRRTLGKKLEITGSSNWFDSHQDKLAHWAAQKIAELPTDKEKALLMMDGLVTNKPVIEANSQFILGHIDDLGVKEKLARLIELHSFGMDLKIKTEIEYRQKNPRSLWATDEMHKSDAEQAAKMAEFERLKAELDAFVGKNQTP